MEQQELFLQREETYTLFQEILADHKSKGWKINASPFFLEFLEGKHPEYDCTPWGNPTRTVFGWQKPCYLLGEGYVKTFKELMETTDWAQYGHKSGNPKCQNCMVSCGFEATAVHDHFSRPGKSLAATIAG